MNKILMLLDKLGRKRVILDRHSDEPYLTRYYLFLKDRDNFPFNIFLHNFHKGDLDDLHDHPWPWCSVILKGGYWEHTPTGRFWRGAGSIKIARSTDFHRIELDPDTDVWTLFIPGIKCRDWGFMRDGQWVQHQRYLQDMRTITEP